jgi:hypothetical protein
MDGVGSCSGDLLAGLAKAGFEFSEGNGIKIGTEDYHEVEARGEFGLMLTEEVADKAFAVVALDGVAHTATGNDAEAGGLQVGIFVLKILDNKKPAVNSSTSTADLLKITL